MKMKKLNELKEVVIKIDEIEEKLHSYYITKEDLEEGYGELPTGILNYEEMITERKKLRADLVELKAQHTKLFDEIISSTVPFIIEAEALSKELKKLLR